MAYARISRFYNTSPTLKHCTGDIWSGLPTHGLLKCSHAPGVIITPACDLANDKVDTLTYLPILSISHWLCTRAIYSEIRGTCLGLLDNLKLKDLRNILPQHTLPSSTELDFLKKEIEKLTKDTRLNQNAQRCIQGVNHLEKIVSTNSLSANITDLESFFGKRIFENIIHKIIRNSLTNDIHFVPSDNQDELWSIIKSHSVVVFRYPLTAPIDVFDVAQNTSLEGWSKEVDRLAITVPFITAFKSSRPLKGLRINPEYLHDLLNRFVNLYSRVGSPDFTNDAIARIYLSIGGVQK